ncbi:MAG: tRNA (N6-threonylcarbamoyladenosine(37)-N6)-methyltransferase TrmO [Lachnospiraceae bacterium]|nr:tRNA (N6-threonylcarbamoyladenosine(37)-N6)-methyltransferase TrmO [Lachnospiraceae bacterium]
MKKNENEQVLKRIARARTQFPEKFGIPRQSGLSWDLKGQIIFEPEYRNETALRGLEGFSHIWLIWGFSDSIHDGWLPTVRPPRLGGNKRMGVFATRSPFRPNPLGLSCVRLEKIELHTPKGPILHIAGADLLDNTPIYDIKPYLSFTDSHADAADGFTDQTRTHFLTVDFPPELLNRVDQDSRKALVSVLSQDPRPSYQHDPARLYGMTFAGYEIKFCVKEDRLTVMHVSKAYGGLHKPT